MSRFHEALRSGRILLMDGAMGTELQRAGLKDGECGELWNITKPGQVRAIHQAYLDAGAQCLLTNSFQSNHAALAKGGLADKLETINRAAIDLARSVAGDKAFVFADIGPIEESWQKEPIQRVVESLRGADAILLETFSDLDALWAVKYGCLPVIEAEETPVLLSITYLRTADDVVTTRGGQTPEVFARLATQYGLAGLGVNCGREIGMDQVIEIIRRYRQSTDMPLFARPNAGTPLRERGRRRYPRTPEQMSARLSELLEAGVRLVGGCCGTTPEHIAAFCAVLKNVRPG
jgi:methionine synthase I (cobalamin-dependent)